MTFLRNTSMAAMRAVRARGGAGPPGGFFGPGTQERTAGYLFGETPLPAGVKRVREDWEYVYTPTMIIAAGICIFGLSSKPNTNLADWAVEEGHRRLEAKEGK